MRLTPLEVELCRRGDDRSIKTRQLILNDAFRKNQDEILSASTADKLKETAIKDELVLLLKQLEWRKQLPDTAADKEMIIDALAVERLIDLAMTSSDARLIDIILQHAKSHQLPVEPYQIKELLAFALESQHLGLIKQLEKHGYSLEPENPYFDEFYTEQCSEDFLSLHLAARGGDIITVAHLLENGAVVNAFDPDHNTALHYACESHSFELAMLLVDNGASPELTDPDSGDSVFDLQFHQILKKEDHLILLNFLMSHPNMDYNLVDIMQLNSNDLKIAAYLIQHTSDYEPIVAFFYSIGRQYIEENELSTAIECFTLVENLNPEHPEVNGALSTAYQQLANQHLERQKRIPKNKGNAGLLHSLGVFKSSNNDISHPVESVPVKPTVNVEISPTPDTSEDSRQNDQSGETTIDSPR